MHASFLTCCSGPMTRRSAPIRVHDPVYKSEAFIQRAASSMFPKCKSNPARKQFSIKAKSELRRDYGRICNKYLWYRVTISVRLFGCIGRRVKRSRVQPQPAGLRRRLAFSVGSLCKSRRRALAPNISSPSPFCPCSGTRCPALVHLMHHLL